MGSARIKAVGWALLLLVIAAGFRFAGLRWGLPNETHYFSYHPDEIFLLQPTVYYFAHGDWNPHFFNYGTLYLYLVGLPALLLNLVPEQFPRGLASLYLLGRTLTALLGIGSVAVLYLAVKKESRHLALLSAAFLAVLPLHVINSHYATVDVPATFWLVLAFLFALRGAEQPSLKLALLTGLTVGLAAATKYNVGLFLIPALLAPLIPPRLKLPRLWIPGVLLGALAGFFLGCPFVGSPEFVRDFLLEVHHARIGGTYAFVNTGSGWGYHLLHGLPVALGFPLLLAVLLGVIAALRLPGRAARLSLMWCLLYFVMIGFSKERFIRYLVPMTPFLAILAAAGLLWLGQLPKRALTVTVLLLTALYTAGQIVPFVTQDPRDRAAAANLTPSIGLVQPPWYFSPPASPYNAGPLTRLAFEEWNRQTGHPILITGWEAAALRSLRPHAFFLSDLEVVDLLRLKEEKATAFVTALGEIYPPPQILARPAPPFAWLAPGRDWAPPDWLYLSPEISLYLGGLQEHEST